MPHQTNHQLSKQMVSISIECGQWEWDGRLRVLQFVFILILFTFFATFIRFNPPYMYDGEFYPNYLSGSGYVFTMDTARKLYNSSMDVPLFHLEDVYLTGKHIIVWDGKWLVWLILWRLEIFEEIDSMNWNSSSIQIQISTANPNFQVCALKKPE